MSNKKKNTILKVISIIVALCIAIIPLTSCSDGSEEEKTGYSRTEKKDNNETEPDENASNKEDEEKEEPSTDIQPEPENPEDDEPKPPVSTSFYSTVKYRSPDAVPADIFKHGRNLMLLNRQYELPEDFKWDLVYWANGNSVDAMFLNCEEHNSTKAVDRAAYQPLKDMFAAAKEAGVPLQLVSAYRSIYLQDKLFTRSVNTYMGQGLSEQKAIEKANWERTFSGTSEHNTGLGFDILQQGNFTLSTSFENSAQFKWLMENAENYGFVLRYAKDKTDITGIMYEPWHFRYVGVEHAKKMNELGMCLEEYIDYLEA